MKIKVCRAHQMAYANDRWHSFYFLLNQLLALEVTEIEISFGEECPYCHQLEKLNERR